MIQGLSTSEPLSELLRHDGFVRALARSLVRDEAAADDLAQETWLRVIGNPPPAVRSPSSWLRNVVRQLAISSYRADEARSARERRAAASPRGSTPEELVEQREVRGWIARGLESLNSSQREVIVLRFYEDLPPREIAARLGVPVETARTRVRRALAALRARLDAAAAGDRGRWLPALAALARLPKPATVVGGAAPLLWGLSVGLLGALGAFLALPGTDAPTAVNDVAGPAPPPARAPTGRTTPEAPVGTAGRVPAAAAARPAPPAAQRGELALAFVESPAGSPAGETAFVLTSSHPTAVEPVHASSDATGRARIELRAGLWELEPARGRPARFRIRAGELTELSIEAPRRVTVAGTVRDVDGAPIAGAEVQLTWPFRDDAVQRRAAADEAGRFELEGVDPNCWIGATAARHRDGDIVFLNDPSRALERRREVDLVLGHSVPSAGGRVLDRDGRPIPGARVQPVLNLRGKLWRRPLRPLVAPAPYQEARITRTDGTFSLEDLQPYTWDLVARAPGYAPALRSILPDGSPAGSQVELRLDEGRSVQGSIRLPDGSPAAGAEVIAGAGAHLGRFVARADAEGRYWLELLPRADLRLSAYTVDGPDALTASTILVGGLGGTVRWDAELLPGGELRGRCLEPSGEPARGVWVALQGSRDPVEDRIPNAGATKLRWAETDERGDFAFAATPSRPYRLDVWELGPLGPRHLDHFEGVRPEPESHLFPLRPSRCSVEGRFVDETGDPRGVAALWIDSSAWPLPRAVPVDPGTGRFRVDDLCAGTYALFSWRPGRTPRKVADRRLDPGQLLLLEPIVLEPPGRIRIRVSDRSDLGEERLDLALYESAAFGKLRYHPVAARRARLGEGSLTLDDVLPGSYVLTAGGSARALEYVPVTVRSSETAELELELLPCVRGPIEIVMPPGEDGRSQVDLALFDAEGRTSVRVMRPTAETGEAPGLLQLPVEVPVGRYSYHVRLVGSPYVASGTLRVSGAGDQRSLGVIELARKGP